MENQGKKYSEKELIELRKQWRSDMLKRLALEIYVDANNSGDNKDDNKNETSLSLVVGIN